MFIFVIFMANLRLGSEIGPRHSGENPQGDKELRKLTYLNVTVMEHDLPGSAKKPRTVPLSSLLSHGMLAAFNLAL